MTWVGWRMELVIWYRRGGDVHIRHPLCSLYIYTRPTHARARTHPAMTSRDVIHARARARHCVDVTDDDDDDDDDDVERDAKFCVYPGPCRGVQDHVRARTNDA